MVEEQTKYWIVPGLIKLALLLGALFPIAEDGSILFSILAISAASLLTLAIVLSIVWSIRRKMSLSSIFLLSDLRDWLEDFAVFLVVALVQFGAGSNKLGIFWISIATIALITDIWFGRWNKKRNSLSGKDANRGNA